MNKMRDLSGRFSRIGVLPLDRREATTFDPHFLEELRSTARRADIPASQYVRDAIWSFTLSDLERHLARLRAQGLWKDTIDLFQPAKTAKMREFVVRLTVEDQNRLLMLMRGLKLTISQTIRLCCIVSYEWCC